MNKDIIKGLTRDEFKELMSEMRKMEREVYKDLSKGEAYDSAVAKIGGKVFCLDEYKFKDAILLLADCATGNYRVNSRKRLVRGGGLVNEQIEKEYSEICSTLLNAVSEMQIRLGLDDASKHEDPAAVATRHRA